MDLLLHTKFPEKMCNHIFIRVKDKLAQGLLTGSSSDFGSCCHLTVAGFFFFSLIHVSLKLGLSYDGVLAGI